MAGATFVNNSIIDRHSPELHKEPRKQSAMLLSSNKVAPENLVGDRSRKNAYGASHLVISGFSKKANIKKEITANNARNSVPVRSLAELERSLSDEECTFRPFPVPRLLPSLAATLGSAVSFAVLVAVPYSFNERLIGNQALRGLSVALMCLFFLVSNSKIRANGAGNCIIKSLLSIM